MKIYKKDLGRRLDRSLIIKFIRATCGISAVALLLFPQLVLGSVLITEIMYDLEGADTGREWIEVKNDGGSDVDMTGWKFFDGANHVLNVPPKNGGRGEISLSAGEISIIAADAVTFISEHGSYRGTVIDTVMNLVNTGGTLMLLDANGIEIDSVTYSKEDGAAGDGYSLNRDGSSLVASSPSPGSAGSFGSEDQSYEDDDNSGELGEDVENNALPKKVIKMFVDGGEDRTVMAGADTVFVGKAAGLQHSFNKTKYYWNFGDGSTDTGETVMHSFLYPGNYAVKLEGRSGNYSAVDFIKVKAVSSPVTISSIDFGVSPYIRLKNNSSSDLDISQFFISAGDRTWSLPPGTFILKNTELTLSARRTGLVPRVTDIIRLVFPNGEIADVWGNNKSVDTAVPLALPIAQKVSAKKVESSLGAPLITISSEEENLYEEVVYESGDEITQQEYLEYVQDSESLAAAGKANDKNGIVKWLTFLILFIGGILSALFYIGRTKDGTNTNSKDELKADDFEIEEDLV